MFQSIDDVDEEEDIVCCEAFDDDGFQAGHLIIDTDGLILGVEVKREHRRKGLATLMLNELRQAGYPIQHDWENMRDDGAAWAASLGATEG